MFKSINVKAIKEDTWREYAKGNRLVVEAIKARIIVQLNAAVERLTDVCWFDLNIGETLKDKKVTSVEFGGANILDEAKKKITVGMGNYIEQEDCTCINSKIRLSYLYVMTNVEDKNGKLVFDVTFEGGLTVQATLEISESEKTLECSGVNSSCSGDAGDVISGSNADGYDIAIKKSDAITEHDILAERKSVSVTAWMKEAHSKVLEPTNRNLIRR